MKIIDHQADENQIRDSFQKGFFSRKKEIVKIEKNFLPCYLFELRFKGEKGDRNIFIICDGLKGKIRRIKWPQRLISSRESFENFLLDEAAALEKAKDEARWFSFSFGLKIKRKYRLVSVRQQAKIGYPFWVVYFKKEGSYNFSVYDGLSGKKEDLFGKDIFLELFSLQGR